MQVTLQDPEHCPTLTSLGVGSVLRTLRSDDRTPCTAWTPCRGPCLLRSPPCRGFTPRLRETYKELMKQGKPFEVIFVSSDQSEEEFDDYFEQVCCARLRSDMI